MRSPAAVHARPFWFSLVVLAVAACALEPALAWLGEHYRKHPLPTRVPLKSLDWHALPSFEPASDTSQFVDHQTDEDAGAAELLMLGLQERAGVGDGGQALLFVTYYNDPDNRVPHTPEVCYRQAGAAVRVVDTLPVEVTIEGRTEQVTVQLVAADRLGARAVIAYVFCVNGRFYTDRNEVRLALGWPGDRGLYFSKVEGVTRTNLDEPIEAAAERSVLLLREGLQELIRTHYPRFADVASGGAGG